MITGDTLYISGLTAVIKRWSCILPSKQWKCLPRCSWLRLHWWRRRRIKIRQKMWWELLLSRVIHSKFFPLSPLKKKEEKKKESYVWINQCLFPVDINLCSTNWSAYCRGCSLSAKKLFPHQRASDFPTHWCHNSSLHMDTSECSEAVGKLRSC